MKWNQRKMSRPASLPVTVGITNKSAMTWCIDPSGEFIFWRLRLLKCRRLGGISRNGYGWIRRKVCSPRHVDVNSGSSDVFAAAPNRIQVLLLVRGGESLRIRRSKVPQFGQIQPES